MNNILKGFLAVGLMAMLSSYANAQKFQADSNVNITSVIITAVNTATVVSTKRSTVYAIDGSNTTSSILYIKLYDAASATCGTGTPIARYSIPGSLSGTNVLSSNANGDAYVNGISMCVVAGVTDASTTAPASGAGTVNIHWKQGNQ